VLFRRSFALSVRTLEALVAAGLAAPGADLAVRAAFLLSNDLAVTAAGGPVLEARDVRKAYGRHQVLNGVALTVQPGQLVAVVGENGAGKSTLLKILAGTLRADRGEVLPQDWRKPAWR
jgi:ABC-type transport system involved in cytochrome bd biosynthesis fused ATPase/permease subunit